jgi:hypothetical protein
MPIGALWSGAVAERVSAPAAMAVGALISLGAALLIFAFAPRVRSLE